MSAEEKAAACVDEEEERWDDWVDDAAAQVCICPLTQKEYDSAEACFQGMKQQGVDVLAIRDSLGLDQLGCIRLINFLRKEKPAGGADIKADDFKDDLYLTPVLENDPLLQYDFEDSWSDDEEDTAPLPPTENSGPVQDASTEADIEEDEEDGDDAEDNFFDNDMDDYFQSYSHFGIHGEMLRDRVRTESYRDFMYQNASLFKDKIVLDVGCGTGILSMFAAKAGARKVYGVDFSSITAKTHEIVIENGLEGVVEIIHGKIEEIELPVKQVDVIVSEWMGYFLLFESMLDSVLFARDKWLAPGGIVVPDQSGMYIVGMDGRCGRAGRVDFWDDVYGFTMKCMKTPALREADVTIAPASAIMTAPSTFLELNMDTVTVKDLEFTRPFTLVVNKAEPLTAFCVYFDIVFDCGGDKNVYFSTGPDHTPTHWKQTLFYLPEPLAVSVGDVVTGEIICKRRKSDHRSQQVTIRYRVGSQQAWQSQRYVI